MKKPKIVGILNVTPDSLYKEEAFLRLEEALDHAKRMVDEGADWIDIGAVSTRPYAPIVEEQEELRRVAPVLEKFQSALSIPFAIDTGAPSVAKMAVESGASMINDIQGFTNPEMRKVGITSKKLLCVRHMQNQPQNMQDNPAYPKGVIQEIKEWFVQQVDLLLSEGAQKEQIILDPGIGFGKSTEDNLMIIKHLHELKSEGYPIYIGLSRKAFIGKILNREVPDRLFGTLALNTLALQFGADYIRVHDVEEHKNALDVWMALMNCEKEC